MSEGLLLRAGAVLVVGVGALWIGARLRLPSILLLLIGGFVVGPLTGFLDPDQLVPGKLLPVIVSISVAIILFEGGLTLRLSEAREVGSVVGRLVTVGMVVGWLLGAFAGWQILGLEPGLSLLLGAILVLSGPTVTGPLLRHVRPRGAVSPILKWEGIVIDPVGALLAAVVFNGLLSSEPETSLLTAIFSVLRASILGTAIGWVAARLLSEAFERHWVADRLQALVTLALVVAVFCGADVVEHESGLFAVTVMGFVLANRPHLSVHHIVTFKENLSTLLIACLFVLLSARLPAEELLAQVWPNGVVFVAVLVLVVRPLAVLASTFRTQLAWNEKLFLMCLFPRGIVAAAVTPLFALRLEEAGFASADRLVPLVYLVVVGTVAVYGFLSSFAARGLGLADRNPQGVVMVGANRFGRELGLALVAQGFEVLMIDTNRRLIRRARMAGLRTHYGSFLAEQFEENVDLGGMGYLLALTSNDDVNSLVTVVGQELFGTKHVFQLAAESKEGLGAEIQQLHLRGRTAFGDEATYNELEDRVLAGGVIKATRLSEEYDFAQFRQQYGEESLVLLRVDESGKLQVQSTASKSAPSAGETVIALVKPQGEEGTSERSG